MIRHATRTLVKSRHPGVWGMLGYTDPPRVFLRRFHLCPETIELGDDLRIEAEILSDSDEPQRLVIDYAMHHVKANGRTSPKVFKLRTLTLMPGEALVLRKRHSFRRITTRRYYPGTHFAEIFINGRSFGRRRFELARV